MRCGSTTDFPTSEYQDRTGLDLGEVKGRLMTAQQRGLLTPTQQGWRPTDLGLRFLNDLQGSFLA